MAILESSVAISYMQADLPGEKNPTIQIQIICFTYTDYV